jgi:NAD(P)-dependent dehydrogenase (short-subunit alcohol dehydrogenase family)
LRPELSAKGRTIVITGGGTSIGAGIAKSFAAAGSTKIAIMSRTEKNLIATKQAIETEFPETQVLVVVADISNMTQVDEGFNKISQAFGKIHIFISNAGFLPVARPLLSPEFDIEDWWTTFNTNVLGVLHSVRGFARFAAEGACLLHISTGISHIPPMEPGISAYAASKAAANRLFEFIATENPDLHVVNIQPGVVTSALSTKSGHRGLDDGESFISSSIYIWKTIWV